MLEDRRSILSRLLLSASPYIGVLMILFIWRYIQPERVHSITQLYTHVGYYSSSENILTASIRVVSHLDYTHFIGNVEWFIIISSLLLVILSPKESWMLIGSLGIFNMLIFLFEFPGVIGFSLFVSGLSGALITTPISFIPHNELDSWNGIICILITILLFLIVGAASAVYQDVLVILGLSGPPTQGGEQLYGATTSKAHGSGFIFGIIVGILLMIWRYFRNR